MATRRIPQSAQLVEAIAHLSRVTALMLEYQTDWAALLTQLPNGASNPDYDPTYEERIREHPEEVFDSALLDARDFLKRFAAHPAAHSALDPVRAMPTPVTYDVREGDFGLLREKRAMLDKVIGEWAGSLSEDDLGHVLKWHNLAGVPFSRPFSALVMHLFNHQTHHRGQATTLLSQAGVDMGATDLLMLIPEA